MSFSVNPKLRLMLAACLILAAQAAAGRAARQEGQTPVFKGESLPEPPRQKEPWTPPPTGLPHALVTAAEKLFEQGLADPRGCEYREVEIVVGGVWGGSAKFKTRAWVLPAGADKGRRFAVSWSGLVYPVASVGEKADLHSDVRALIKSDEALRAKWAGERPRVPFGRHTNATSEGGNVSHETLLPIKACLLLRLGEAALAEQLWGAVSVGSGDGANGLPAKDPYPALAEDWAWAMFDRAVCAHMRGDDRLALLTARALAPAREDILKEVESRGEAALHGRRTDEYSRDYYLSFLKQLPELEADQERRAKEGAGGPPSPSRKRWSQYGGRPSKPLPPVEALISSLEEIDERQTGQPGGVSLGESQAVIDLAARGEEAVEPLLRVLESDDRLTRSVSFHRDFFRTRHLIGVHEAAYVALVRILKNSTFLDDTNYGDLTERGAQGRRALASRMRLYLEKYGRLPPEERWYAVLADDRARTDEWLQAAASIIHPLDEGPTPNWAFTHAPTPAERSEKNILLRSEALRGKTSPSVSELLARRMFEAARRKEVAEQARLEAATNFALALVAWDGQKHMEEVRLLQSSMMELYGAGGDDPYRRPHLMSLLVNLYVKRGEAGDAAALEEYANWLSTIKPEEAGNGVVHLFTPMWRFADDPAVGAAAARMFGREGSAWSPLIDAGRRESFYAAQLLETPMLNLKEFREQAIRGLSDKSAVATLKLRRGGAGSEYELRVEDTYGAVLARGMNVSSAYIGVTPDDPRAGELPASINVRACDVYASQLKRLSGAPRFEIYWAETERDLAVTELQKFLRGHRGRFTTSLGLY